MRAHLIRTLVICISLVAWGTAAVAAPVTIENNGAWARIWPEIADPDQGMDIWTINAPDGVDWNIMHQQWFWYSVDAGSGPGPESPLEALDATPFVFTSDGDGDTVHDTAFLRYTDNTQGLEISVRYILTGGPDWSGVSDIAEIINISNIGNASFTVHFFQFCQFNLSVDEDVVQITQPNTAAQWFNTLRTTETVATRTPTAFQAGLAADLLALLNDTGPTVLDGTTGPLTGEVGWAFQWDVDLNPGEALLISKDKSVILMPEPATLALAGLGAAALLARRRRR